MPTSPSTIFSTALPSSPSCAASLLALPPSRVIASVAARCSSAFVEMDGTTGSSLFPLQRCKTVHLVRHAQGVHNVVGEKDYTAYLSPELFDAHLTPLGWNQVDNLRKHIKDCGLSKKIELVITSPLLRTMQTAVGVFGGDGYNDGVSVPVLMVENTGNSGRPAISSLNCPPIIAVEYCREHLGVHPCDKRRSISEYQPLFPAIDFSLIENNEDVLWKPDIRETNEELAARGVKFLNCLTCRFYVLIMNIPALSLGNFVDLRVIIHQTTCPCTSQQNGVAERKNRHLLDVARALMFHMHVPKYLWGDAVLTATYLVNCVPTSSLHGCGHARRRRLLLLPTVVFCIIPYKSLVVVAIPPLKRKSANTSPIVSSDQWCWLTKACLVLIHRIAITLAFHAVLTC